MIGSPRGDRPHVLVGVRAGTHEGDRIRVEISRGGPPLTVLVKITPNDRGTRPSKLADAELHFTGGALDGLKLIGFSVWERRGGKGRRVSFPGRQYRIGDERRAFALLRPTGNPDAQAKVRDMVLEAYARFVDEPDGGAGTTNAAQISPR
jgi:hypothetical protein